MDLQTYIIGRMPNSDKQNKTLDSSMGSVLHDGFADGKQSRVTELDCSGAARSCESACRSPEAHGRPASVIPAMCGRGRRGPGYPG